MKMKIFIYLFDEKMKKEKENQILLNEQNLYSYLLFILLPSIPLNFLLCPNSNPFCYIVDHVFAFILHFHFHVLIIDSIFKVEEVVIHKENEIINILHRSYLQGLFTLLFGISPSFITINSIIN